MLDEVKGLVLRVTNVGESDRMLTIYTEEAGLISAMAKGSRSLKSSKLAATSQFCYASFILFTKGDKYWVREASLIESFFGLRNSIEALALAAYVVDVLSDVATADPEPELLRLTLNSLFAIAEKRAEIPKIKAAFEMRAMAILGFMPEVLSCAHCGRREGEFFFDVMAGMLECDACHKRSVRTHTTLSDEHESHLVFILSYGAKLALSYCIYSPLEKLFSFTLSSEDMHIFSRVTEGYLINHLEHSFKTLDFYYEVNP